MGDGREAQEGGGHMSVYLWLIHVDAWQKPAQYCKAIIFLLKKNTGSFSFSIIDYETGEREAVFFFLITLFLFLVVLGLRCCEGFSLVAAGGAPL